MSCKWSELIAGLFSIHNLGCYWARKMAKYPLESSGAPLEFVSESIGNMTEKTGWGNKWCLMQQLCSIRFWFSMNVVFFRCVWERNCAVRGTEVWIQVWQHSHTSILWQSCSGRSTLFGLLYTDYCYNLCSARMAFWNSCMWVLWSWLRSILIKQLAKWKGINKVLSLIGAILLPKRWILEGSICTIDNNKWSISVLK